MYVQTRSEYARARLISESPLTFELAFDPAGRSSFGQPHATFVQLATRHLVTDICELRQGFQSPWQITQPDRWHPAPNRHLRLVHRAPGAEGQPTAGSHRGFLPAGIHPAV